LPDLELERESRGRGTILFGPQPTIFGRRSTMGLAIWVPALQSSGRLTTIDDAHSVFDLIQKGAKRPI